MRVGRARERERINLDLLPLFIALLCESKRPDEESAIDCDQRGSVPIREKRKTELTEQRAIRDVLPRTNAPPKPIPAHHISSLLTHPAPELTQRD